MIWEAIWWFSYHRCPAVSSWWSPWRPAAGCGRLSQGRSAGGRWRLSWPRSWRAAEWARRSLPARTPGSLAGSDNRHSLHSHSRQSVLVCHRLLLAIQRISSFLGQKKKPPKTHRRVCLHAGSCSLLPTFCWGWKEIQRSIDSVLTVHTNNVTAARTTLRWHNFELVIVN